jgi:type III secretory pathway component EscU
MSESEDDSSKTEEPSAKKLEEARKKGQIASTRELYHFFMMLSFLFFVMFLGPQLVGVHGIHSIEAHKALCCSLPALAKLAWLATGLVALCMNGADITSFSV